MNSITNWISIIKQLKQDILSGKYSSVQEDITAGKELGNYDVWFKGTPNGEVETSYTLWDLDSVQALFELKDVIDINLKHDIEKEKIINLKKNITRFRFAQVN